MHRNLKISIITILSLILSVIAVLGFIIATFNQEDYRKSAIFLVNNLTDFQIEITEPFNFAISTSPELKAAKLKLFRPGSTDPLEFKHIQLKLIPATLLRGQLQLTVGGQVEETKTLKWLLPKELLALDLVKFTTGLSTDFSSLNLQNLSVDGSNNNRGLTLKITGTGLIDDFSAPQPFTKLDLSIIVKAAKSRSLQGYLPDKLPEMGPVQGSLRLVARSARALAAKDIKLDFGREDKLYLRTTGQISNIPIDPEIINTGINFHLDLRSATTAIIAKRLPAYLPEIGAIRLTADFSGSKKKSRLENITFSNTNPSGLELQVNGNLALADPNSNAGKIMENVALRATVKAPAGAALPSLSQGSTFRLKVPKSGPLTTTCQLIGNSQKISLKNFSGNFGETSLTADLEVSLSEKPPRLTGSITIPTLFPDDFMECLTSTPPTTEIQTADTKKLSDDKKPAAVELFSRQPLPRNWLHNCNCNLQLSVIKVADSQKSFRNLRNLNLTINLDNGQLQIDPATLGFEGGYAKASIFLDDTGSTPKIKMEFTVDDLDLTGFLTSFEIDSPLSGEVTLHSKVSSQGRSLHDLASKLDGDFGIVLEKGIIPNQTLKLVATDILGWSFSKILMQEKHAKINCCILSLEINQGVITSRAFIFDSKVLTVTGAGTIDLTTETCDLTILPKKKRNILAMVTPVTITGSIQDPRVMAIPIKKAALLYGGALLAPQFFLPAIGVNYLWGMISKDGGGPDNPCLEYLHQQAQSQSGTQPKSQSKNPPGDVPPPSDPVSRH